MPNTALVTGASSGLGEEFARLHAERGGDVILVARREDQLNTLKTELEKAHGVSAHVMAMDLGQHNAADRLYDQIKAADLTVDVLINNAGFGGHGLFVDRDLEKDLAMIDLNVRSLVALCHRFGADMAARGSGKILNVGSTAGFMPGPLQATYFATKAFVNSFSQALDQELRPKGVTVTVLAPGYVRTEFAQAADLEGTELVNQKGASARSAAKHGYEAMRDGKLVTVNEGLLSFMVNWVIPFLPRRQAMKMVERMQTK